MIDAKDMSARLMAGLQQIGSLEGEELLALQLYCQMFAKKTLDDGCRREAPLQDLMINALKNGIALGLRLRIQNSEVLGR